MDHEKLTIDWNDVMSVGIPEIDEDHKRFVALVHAFNDSIAEQMHRTNIRKCLQDILDDAVVHFAHEERLFEEWHYPDAGEHTNKHAQLTSLLEHIMANTVNFGFDSEWIEVGLKVKAALINHILTEDMKYAEFCRKSLRSDSLLSEPPVTT